MMTHKCKNLFAKIDELEKDYIGFWKDVCKIESPTDYKEGIDRVGKYFMEKAEAYGWKIEVQKQPVSGDCILITMNPEVKEPPVVFSGHMDTVHPIGSFGENVVTWDEEKIYGPGVLDCKGGAVAAFLAMAALNDTGFKRRPILLLLQSDEENNSCTSNRSTIRFMCEKSVGCVAFLNCEECVPDTATVSRKGISRYEMEVTGTAAHAAKCYEGVSAIREAAYKIVELENWKSAEGITCNCGLIKGGTSENTVPDKCVLTVDVRFSNKQEMMEADSLVQVIAARSFVEGTSTRVTAKSRRPAMEKTERNLALLDRINEIYEQEGMMRLEAAHKLGGSDAAEITEYGIPCLDGFGVSGGALHSRNEFAYLNSLTNAAKKLAAVAYCI